MAEKKFDVKERLDEIDERVMSGLTPFQRATVEHIDGIYGGAYGKNRRRVLVADEVGLGKTLVARGVISKIAKRRKAEGDDLVKIAYICSNGAIAAQNIEKLAIDGDIQLAPSDASRLSMQHLAIAREKGDSLLKQRYVQITPLTPSTSFSMTTGTGTLYERALMLAVLQYDERFNASSGRRANLADLMWAYERGFQKGSWKYWKQRACGEVANARDRDPDKGENSGYPYDVLRKVAVELELGDRSTLDEIADYLDKGERSNNADRRIVKDLRKAFSNACVDMLDPDFVIMDEFQRFHELIADSDSETAMLAKRFFAGDTRILLLSATPFRMFSTAAELDDGGFGDSYREFLEVMDFLNKNQKGSEQEFEETWGSYTISLQRLGSGACDVLSIQHAKSKAEESVRKSTARTERQSTGELGAITDNLSHAKTIEVSADDVQAYVRMRELAESAGVPRALVQVDYAKSCPFPISFMSRYKFFSKLRDEVKKRPELVKADKKYDDGLLWLRRWDVASYAKIKVSNARYKAFMYDLVGQSGLKLEQLLWIPPNKPYYQPPKNSPFAQAQGFSKFLLFSAWSMVPPSLATLLSYEFERKNVLALESITDRSYRYFKDEDSDAGEDRDDQALPYRRMRFDSEQRNAFLLLYPSRYLASLIDVTKLVNECKTLSEVRRMVGEQISQDLSKALGVNRLPRPREASTRRTMDWYIMAALKLDEAHGCDVMGELLASDKRGGYQMADRYRQEGRVLSSIAQEYVEWNPSSFDGYPADLVKVLTNAAIGSPAVCAMRCYGRMFEGASAKYAFEFGHAFINRMNTASSTLAVAAAMEVRGERTIHWKNMLAYGCEGNIQAMIDEYAHVCQPVRSELDDENVLSKTHKAMVGEGSNPNCHLAETRHGVLVPNYGHASERIGSMVMRTNIASAFMDARSSKKNENVVSRVRLRNAFNSPFRPFVLISTSIGQEGLDFHLYCRKICHWNLPTNPIDLEQREGRVNRYKGLAVRRSIAERYGDMEFDNASIWEQLFQVAERDEIAKGGHDESSGLLPYWGVTDGAPMAKVERYVYLYPFSRDVARYERLIADVYRYRSVMGMPDQEELLHMLEDRIASGDLSEEDLRSLFVNLCPFTWVDEGR